MSKKNIYITSLFVVMILSRSVFASNNIIKNIKFIGNDRYSEATYNEYINVKIGDIFKQNITNNIIKDLYKSDLIDDVNVNFKNNTLTINIKEKTFIKKITFIGNKKLKDEVIKENLKLKVKQPFSHILLNEDLEFINNFYKSIGLLNTQIEHEIKNIEKNLIEVVFTIKESKKTKIKNIYFIGNNVFSDTKLKEELFSRENKFYRFGRRINYNADILEYDSYLLKMFYLSRGYIDFELNSAIGKFNKKNNTFDIVFDINEGNKYNFGNIDIIDNIGNVDTEIIKNKILNIKSDSIFNIKNVHLEISKITKYLTNQNKHFFAVNMQILPNKTKQTVDVNFTIDETEKFYIGKIKIKNNTRTTDSVIRQQLTIHEGDPFSENSIERSIQKIKNLGFFKTVNYTKTEGIIPNQYDITIEVEEQSTGSLNFGIGYNSSYGINGNIEINQRNLFGNGNKLSFGVNINEYNNNFSFGFTKPNFLGTNIVSGANVFYQDLNNIDNSHSNVGYNKLSYGFRTFLSFDLTEYLSNTITYSYTFNELSDMASDYKGILSENDDKTSEISLNFSYDKRDSYYNPTKGYLLNYEIAFAGIGGTKDYIQQVLHAMYYYPLYMDTVILKVEGKYSTIKSINNNPLFPNDGFYLGGYSMRGFESGGIGPRVKSGNGAVIDDYGLGGTELYYFNTEIKFPLFVPKEFSMFGVLFFNAGTVSGIEDNPEVNKNLIYDNDSIRSSAGFSILWQTYVGNLSIDFSKTIKKEHYDRDENFRFNIGTNF